MAGIQFRVQVVTAGSAGGIRDNARHPFVPGLALRMSSTGAPTASDPPPTPPEPPLASDCCGGGCNRCVYDLHDEAMDRYRQELARWQARQPES